MTQISVGIGSHTVCRPGHKVNKNSQKLTIFHEFWVNPSINQGKTARNTVGIRVQDRG